MSTMQRRHFVAIAAIVKAHSVPGLAEAFADMLEQSNPLFQRARFLEACKPGLTPEERKAAIKHIEKDTE